MPSMHSQEASSPKGSLPQPCPGVSEARPRALVVFRPFRPAHPPSPFAHGDMMFPMDEDVEWGGPGMPDGEDDRAESRKTPEPNAGRRQSRKPTPGNIIVHKYSKE